MKPRQLFKNVALKAFGMIALIAIWKFVITIGAVSQTVLPSPGDVALRIATDFGQTDFWSDVRATTYRWLVGYLGGVVVGVPVGLLLGSNRTMYSASEFVIDFLRSLPVTAIFPVFLLMFGIGDTSKIAMVFAATVFIVILNSAYGVINASLIRRKVAYVFGANKAQVLSQVIVMEALPQVSVGIRTTLSLSLIVVVVSEMFIGTRFGLGERVFTAYQMNQPDMLFATVVVLGMIGYILNALYVVSERRLVFWAGE